MREARLPGKRDSNVMLYIIVGLTVAGILFVWRLRTNAPSSSSADAPSFYFNGQGEVVGIEEEESIMAIPPPPPPAAAAIATTKTVLLEYFSSEDCSSGSLLSTQESVFNGDDDEGEYREFGYVRDATRSLRLTSAGLGYAEFTTSQGQFLFSLFPLDGCVTMYSYPRPSLARLFARSQLQNERQISQSALDKTRAELLGHAPVTPHAQYRVVFSCESKEYFGYQTWANRLAFSRSQQGQDATWTRLLTCHSPDDIAQISTPKVNFPTFTAHRHPFSEKYGPINKPDVITKWFASQDAPKEEVIVVIDPDSWLLLPLYDPFISKIERGKAIGQEAYYYGSRTAQLLWKELCELNCDMPLDLVGVPYVIHRDDLAELAPLWKHYVLKIKHRMEFTTPGSQDFNAKYGKLDVAWAAEMFGYNLAAAHLNIKHEAVNTLQVRDVDSSCKTEERCKHKASLHMGRAWFPTGHPEAKPWLHTEGRSFKSFGDQVWCKCNYTASTVKPWPIPDGLDFVSKRTLTLLHDSDEEYGPVPNNQEWRRNQNLRSDYGWAHV